MFEQYQYQSPQGQIKDFFRGKSALARLVLINLFVFLLVNLIGLFLWLFEADQTDMSPIMPWLAVSADTEILLQRPWTLITYMFYQEDFFHILFNMIVLVFGGRIFEEFLGGKRLSITYIFGGIIGALFFILSYNFFPVFRNDLPMAVALGSSASVLAVLVAAATYVPEYSVPLILFGKVKLKHIAIILVVMDVFSIQRGNPGGHIAHIGGALWGFVSVIMMKNGLDVSAYMPDFAKFSVANKSKSRMRPGPYKSKDSSPPERPLTDEEYNRQKIEHQRRMDAILDKISHFGYDRLSKEEKEYLFKSGKND